MVLLGLGSHLNTRILVRTHDRNTQRDLPAATQVFPTNTVEMQRRGLLIRRTLRDDIKAIGDELRAALGIFGPEFDVDASDGIGRKTEAPWVRFFAKSMAPTPRDGFYVVIHFAADGGAVFITLGCGSTIWANGELRPVSDDELTARTHWARTVILETFGTTGPFSDEIVLGARAPLTKTFEKATAVAKRLPVQNLREEDVRRLLVQAAERLREVYAAQRLGRHLTAAQTVELEVESIARPTRYTSQGQGFRLSVEERKAIELRAMEVAREWLVNRGYEVLPNLRTEKLTC